MKLSRELDWSSTLCNTGVVEKRHGLVKTLRDIRVRVPKAYRLLDVVHVRMMPKMLLNRDCTNGAASSKVLQGRQLVLIRQDAKSRDCQACHIGRPKGTQTLWTKDGIPGGSC